MLVSALIKYKPFGKPFDTCKVSHTCAWTLPSLFSQMRESLWPVHTRDTHKNIYSDVTRATEHKNMKTTPVLISERMDKYIYSINTIEQIKCVIQHDSQKRWQKLETYLMKQITDNMESTGLITQYKGLLLVRGPHRVSLIEFRKQL